MTKVLGSAPHAVNEVSSWLRDMYGPADHGAPPGDKHPDDRVHPAPPALLPDRAPHDPFPPTDHAPAADAPGHSPDYAQARGYGRAFKVLRFPRGVLGQRGDGDVEAREAGEAAEDEEGQEEGVEWGAKAEGKGARGGGDTEGDLHAVRDGWLEISLFSLKRKKNGGGGRVEIVDEGRDNGWETEMLACGLGICL